MATLVVTVAAVEDDAGTGDSGSTWTDDNERMDCGGSNEDERSARLTGLSGELSGATINSADFKVAYRSSELGSMTVVLKCELAAGPAIPTSYAQFTGRSYSSGTSWTAYSEVGDFTSTIDIGSELQEVVDIPADPTAIHVAMFGDGTGQLRAWADDRAGEPGAELSIDYTAGGVNTRRYTLTTLGVG